MTGAEFSPIPVEARPYQGTAAGLVTRLVANTIDAFVVAGILAGVYLALVGALFVLDPRSFTMPDLSLLGSITVILGILVTYLTLAWWLVGRTYGDHVMGLRVEGRIRGRRLGFFRSLLRAGFCAVFPIGLFWCLISPARRSVQDALLWTKVVYDWRQGNRINPSTPTATRADGPEPGSS